MTLPVVRTDRAKADLAEILTYLEEHRPAAAERFAASVSGTINGLREGGAMMPRMNREWHESVFRAVAAGQRPDWAVVPWCAQDRYGRLGMFESVGQPILRATFRELDAYLAALEAIDGLPCVTTAEVIAEGSRKQTVEIRQLAERGLYVFDSWEGEDWAKRYRLAAAPVTPLTVDQLPAGLQDWFSALLLKRAEFRRAREQPLDLTGKGMEWVGDV